MVLAMSRIIAAFAVAAAFAAPAAAAERRYAVTDFDRVLVEGPYAVRLVTGRPSAATATGSQDALDRVVVDVQGGTLRVRPNRSAWGGSPATATSPVTIELATRALRGAGVNGPGSLAIDRAQGLRLDLTVRGSGRLSVGDLRVDNLSIGLLGSGRMQLAGTAQQVRADVQGWGELDARALTAQGVTLVTDTSGAVAISAVRQATVTASGIGEVEMLGSPACTVRGLSAAQVRCGTAVRR